MSLIREKPRTISGRSHEVTRTYLQRGQAVSRSLWIRVSPKHPLLKAVMAPPIAVLVLTMLVLLLIMLGFTLLAIALIGAITRGGAKDTEELDTQSFEVETAEFKATRLEMVTTVVTVGNGSMDLYGQRLCQKLGTRSVYLSFPESFGTSLLSSEALKFLFTSYKVLKALSPHKILHLTNHHLARYALFPKSIVILTVHDLIRQFDRMGLSIYIHQPNLRDRIDLWLDWLGIKRANHIIAISQNTKKDLVDHAGIPEERISVIYHGVDHHVFYPRQEPKPFDYPYILFVGSEHPRKNLASLLRAFRQFKTDSRFEQLKLVKVGKAGGKEFAFRARTLDLIESLGLANEVVFAGFVSDEMLASYYSHAECLVLPSFYEGFGWPVVEAMACGCPVITSNLSSLPEVAGDAAIMVDPQDIAGLANALREVLTNSHLKQTLKAKGLVQASKFTWEKTASETLAVYAIVEEAVRKSSRHGSFQSEKVLVGKGDKWY